jgi:ABC-type multidrug transport system ATPase subunit
MDEASLCDRIALIQEGKILSINDPEGIISNYSKDLYSIKAESLSLLLKELRNNPQIDSCHSFGEYIHITLKGSTEELEKELAKKTIKGLSKIEKIKPTIEDCFINLMEN